MSVSAQLLQRGAPASAVGPSFRVRSLSTHQLSCQHFASVSPQRQTTRRSDAVCCSAAEKPDWAPSKDVVAQGDVLKLEDLQRRFKLADLDGNGRIDLNELRALLESTQLGESTYTQHWYTEDEVGQVMAYYDVDNSGDICYDEFVKLITDGLLLDGKLDEYKAAFDAVDVNGSGTISATELAQLLARLEKPVTYDEMSEIMAKYDKDESGQLDFSEFLRMFRDRLLDLNSIVGFILGGEQGTSAALAEAPSGSVQLIFSDAELDDLLTAKKDRLVVVFASLTWCRPCKAMLRPYEKLADAYKSAIFVKLFGNSNNNTKALFKQRLRVRSTPTFLMFRNGELAGSMTGANKEKLETNVRLCLKAEEMPAAPVYLTEAAPAPATA